MMQPSRTVASGVILALCWFALASGADTPASKAAPAEPLANPLAQSCAVTTPASCPRMPRSFVRPIPT